MNKVSKDNFTQEKYKYGFVTEIESEKIPKGLNEDVIKLISKKKNEPEWMLEWRLSAFKRLENMSVPKWAKAEIDEIDFQDLYYYSSPKDFKEKPKSLDEVDPKLLETYEKLGIPLKEQKVLAGVAVDAVEQLSVGDSVTGTGIPGGTTISAINTGTKTITLSAAITADQVVGATLVTVRGADDAMDRGVKIHYNNSGTNKFGFFGYVV